MSNAKVTAAALALSRSERIRLAAALLSAEGEAERAADLEALARSTEMEEAPGRFVAKGPHAEFTRKLRNEIRAKARTRAVA